MSFSRVLISTLVALLLPSLISSQSIGYGMPNFGLPYNPYTSSAWGYGLGPQYSSLRGALAYGMLGGQPAIGGLGYSGLALTGLLGMSPYGGGFGGNPALSGGVMNQLGIHGRFPGSLGMLNGFGGYPGLGGIGDFDHYRWRDSPDLSAPPRLPTSPHHHSMRDEGSRPPLPPPPHPGNLPPSPHPGNFPPPHPGNFPPPPHPGNLPPLTHYDRDGYGRFDDSKRNVENAELAEEK